MIGKDIRLARIINCKSKKTVIVPMDHGISLGPIEGLSNMKKTLSQVAKGGANAVIIHRGMVALAHRRCKPDMGLIIHLSGATCLSPKPNAKTLVCTVEDAIKIGADAVSVHINIGDCCEKEMLTDLGNVANSASKWGIPLLAMIYPRGENVKDEYSKEAIKHAARLGGELGADVVKVSYTGDPESFREVIEGCHTPVVIAGGPMMELDKNILKTAKGAMEAGAIGVSIGRNIFQHKNPDRMVAALSMIVHQSAKVEEAERFLNSGDVVD